MGGYVSLRADDSGGNAKKDLSFSLFQYGYQAFNVADLSLTLIATQSRRFDGKLEESNPFVGFYIDKPVLAIALNAGISYGIHVLTN